jgi:transcriptional regulator with XRE-family HTH domain
MDDGASRVFPALLRHWRVQRGHSQLDLALAADVSSRHISFLETGRARPSREMVLRLAAALNLRLRDQNALLHAAGFPAQFAQPSFPGELPIEIARALEQMLAQHEPFPMLVLSSCYDVLRANAGASRLLSLIIAEPSAQSQPPNALRTLFDPRLARPSVVDWEHTARALLSRLHREALARPSDNELAALRDRLLEYPSVPESFRQPDFSTQSPPTFTLRLRVPELGELAFLSTLTVFNAPQNVTLEEIRIEAYFPGDEHTRARCLEFASKHS